MSSLTMDNLNEQLASFRSSVPQKKVLVINANGDEEEWLIYEAGPRSVTCPLVFLPPNCAPPEVYFLQILHLSSVGFRVISVRYPPVSSIQRWSASFSRLLDELHIEKVHLFGCGGGGFLAQKFVELTAGTLPRVASLILCNSFVDINIIRSKMASGSSLRLLPAAVLRRDLLGNLQVNSPDSSIASVNAFMLKQSECLSSQEISARLGLLADCDYVQLELLQDLDITIIDACDENMLPAKSREDLYKSYPHARWAHLKSGGDFPFLSRPEEVNVFCRIHCKRFILAESGTGRGRFSPCE